LFALVYGVTCGQSGLQRGGGLSRKTIVLGLESSCDDTAAAVLMRDVQGELSLLSSVVHSQTQLHAKFGGVVPEIAARAHVEVLDHCVEEALSQAALDLSDIDAIAVTAGPGLIGGVVAGVMLAKGLAAATGKPLYGVNHLAGHALTPRLTHDVAFPYLMLLVSGGHCQFLLVKTPTEFERLGGTIDDAPGEAFDKVARLLGLSQPGGPAVEAAARSGDPDRLPLPRPLLDRPDCDLSFSGLKTAVLRLRDKVVAEQDGLPRQDRADICASFQAAVVDVLVEKSRRAMALYLAHQPQSPTFCVAGGVAANQSVRAGLETICRSLDVAFVAPPISLCTDNAAMIALCALEQMDTVGPSGLAFSARPRWPLDTKSASMLGSGKKGAKA
jgi:N6-L-threonylcarbamoyladenine synthase